MYKIIDDEKVLEVLPAEDADIKREQITIHIKHSCGCLIIQDKKGFWLETCTSHSGKMEELKNKGFLQ